MRDDLKILFSELISHYKKKNGLLNRIISNEPQLSYLAHTENLKDLDDLIMTDNELIAGLDSLEFEIRSVIRRICGISGIEIRRFRKYFLLRKEEPFPGLKELIDHADETENRLINERDQVIRNMEKKLKNYKDDIESIARIRRLKKNTEYEK